MVAPNTASDGLTGTSAVKSSPATANFGCGLSCNLTNKSPVSAPPVPSCPCLGILTTEPVRAPGGILTSIVFGLRTCPVPLQVVQTTPLDIPDPLQVGQ